MGNTWLILTNHHIWEFPMSSNGFQWLPNQAPMAFPANQRPTSKALQLLSLVLELLEVPRLWPSCKARHDMSQRFRQVWLIRCVNGQFGTCSSQCSHLTNLNYTSLVLRVNSPSTRWPYCRCFFFLCHCWLPICGCTPSGSVWTKYQNTE